MNMPLGLPNQTNNRNNIETLEECFGRNLLVCLNISNLSLNIDCCLDLKKIIIPKKALMLPGD